MSAFRHIPFRLRALAVAPAAAVIVGTITFGMPLRGQTPAPVGLLGFQASRVAPELDAERRFVERISTERMSTLHRTVTRNPHIAGSPASMDVADAVRKAFEELGLETTVHDYQVYLSTPKRISVEVLTPSPEPIAVREPINGLDPDSAHPDLGPAFVAYSATGTVAAPAVYVNYGLPADYARVRAAGVDVKGKIAIARYARSHRAVKIHTAETEGAAGLIIYSDPLDDGFAKGLVWPDGPWRADFQAQSGNGKYSWFWHGDPLTPGVGATSDAVALDPASVPTLPKIPVVVLAWKEAAKILGKLQGPPALPGFQGGLPFTYRLGPGPVTVKLDVQMDASRRPIRDVVGRIRGKDPDRWVILGGHHDAWTFGGMDPGSGLAALYGAAAALADLRKSGWTPERTIVFAVWDAEEFGLVGSTEFAEAFGTELREKAVCYINTDLSMVGHFDGGGTPSLRDFLVEVARAVPGLEGKGTVYDGWRAYEWQRQPASRRRLGPEEFEVDLAALGSGADFVAFQDHLGLPTLQMEFDFEGSYGPYHSNYDSRWYVERFSDPTFHVTGTLARVLGIAMMRLASADVLPYRYSYYGQKIGDFLTGADDWARDEDGRRVVPLDLTAARARAAAIAQKASALERTIDARLKANTLSAASARQLNSALAHLEQTLLDESAPAAEHWYRHVIYGWNIYSLYEGQPLPGLADATRIKDATKVAAEQRRIELALDRMARGLDAMRP